MKKITLIMLIAMVPFVTLAQKRIKKDKNSNTNNKIVYADQFMIIHASVTQPPALSGGNAATTNVNTPRSNSRVKVSFDFGGVRFESAPNLQETKYRSVSHALNSAIRYGWEFVDANVVEKNGTSDHYIYMKMRKK